MAYSALTQPCKGLPSSSFLIQRGVSAATDALHATTGEPGREHRSLSLDLNTEIIKGLLGSPSKCAVLRQDFTGNFRLRVEQETHENLGDSSLGVAVAYDFDVHLYGAEDTEVLIYNSYTDHLQDSLAEVHKAAERAFGWLASDSAQAWWHSLVEEDQARMGLWSGDPAIVAEHVSEMVILTPHALALPGEYPWKKFAADELHAAYRQAFGSGYLFKLGSESIHRYDGEQDEFVDEDPALVTLAWLVFEWDADHALSFRLLLGLSTLLIVLLVVNRPRFDNSATSLRLTRSTGQGRQAR